MGNYQPPTNDAPTEEEINAYIYEGKVHAAIRYANRIQCSYSIAKPVLDDVVAEYLADRT